TDPTIAVPVMEMTLGDLSSSSRTRLLQYIYNFRRLYLDLDMEAVSHKRTIIEKESDIYSLVREIIRSGLTLREYLETRGIYVLELDRCKGFEGGIYACGDVLFIVLNKDHSDEKKFQMLIELSASCLLYFDEDTTEEQMDDLFIIFCEEILKYLPCEQTFSILAKLVAMAVSRELISPEKDKEYLYVPSR
ncbi:MAG: hypothetical protein MJZ16_14575, partial [Bacteroidales bacterium]|nr:hypothetical protein [Bacteroidales bacterium]